MIRYWATEEYGDHGSSNELFEVIIKWSSLECDEQIIETGRKRTSDRGTSIPSIFYHLMFSFLSMNKNS